MKLIPSSVIRKTNDSKEYTTTISDLQPGGGWELINSAHETHAMCPRVYWALWQSREFLHLVNRISLSLIVDITLTSIVRKSSELQRWRLERRRKKPTTWSLIEPNGGVQCMKIAIYFVVGCISRLLLSFLNTKKWLSELRVASSRASWNIETSNKLKH